MDRRNRPIKSARGNGGWPYDERDIVGKIMVGITPCGDDCYDKYGNPTEKFWAKHDFDENLGTAIEKEGWEPVLDYSGYSTSGEDGPSEHDFDNCYTGYFKTTETEFENFLKKHGYEKEWFDVKEGWDWEPEEDYDSFDMRQQEAANQYDPETGEFDDENNADKAAEFSSVKRGRQMKKSVKSSKKENPLKNHSITSGLLDKAEDLRKNHFGTSQSITIYHDDVEYNFERADNDGWNCWCVNVDNAIDNKWGIATGVEYTKDELEDLFGYGIIDNDSNITIEEDDFWMDFHSDDEPEDWSDSDDFEYQNYVCDAVGMDYGAAIAEEGDYLTNDEMYKLVDDIQNGNTSYYGAYIDEDIEPSDVYPQVEGE